MGRSRGVMPESIDLSRWRAEGAWRVNETRSHVIMWEQRLNVDLTPLTTHLDDIRDTVSSSLLLRPDLYQESPPKSHVWVYHPDALHVPGTSVQSRKPKLFYGTVDGAGMHLVSEGLQWDSPLVLDRVLHECVHSVWGNLVGEAPSLLNEGIAAWLERKHTHEAHPRLAELDGAWKDAQREGRGWLAPLMVNDGFWRARDRGLDTYAVGGYLTRAIAIQHGLCALAAIFRDVTYEATHLADVLNQHLGVTTADLETLN